MDRGAWQDAIYRVACSQTRLKPLSLGGRTLRGPCALGEASVTQGVCRGALGKVSYERMPEGSQRRGASARGKGVRWANSHRDTCRTRCLREPAALPGSKSCGRVQWGRGRGKGPPVARSCLTLRDPVDCDSPGGSDGKASACNAGDPGSIPGWGRSFGEENGNPLQYSCQENPMDRGAWRSQSMGSQRVGHNGATEHAHTHHCTDNRLF